MMDMYVVKPEVMRQLIPNDTHYKNAELECPGLYNITRSMPQVVCYIKSLHLQSFLAFGPEMTKLS